MSQLEVIMPDYEGTKCIEIFTGERGNLVVDENGVVQTDSRGFPLLENCTRIYLDDIPGGPAWPQSRIDAGIAMVNAALPDDWKIRRFSEDPGRAHIQFEFYRVGYEP